MQQRPNLTLFSDKLFGETSGEHHLADPRVSRLVAQAMRELQEQAGRAYGVLSQNAQEALPFALSGFLARLLLLQPAPGYTQKVTRFWVNAQREMLCRLKLDRAKIEQRFADGHSCGQLTEVTLDLSDRHNQGRSVAALTFESGLKLVYKPRDIGIEDWYFQTLAYLDQIGAPLPFLTPKVLRRPGYGWVQFISHRRCRSKEEVSRYYRNAGAMVCVLYIIGAADCHFQNLVACGEYPVLVDAETLFQPELSDSEPTSVTRTGMVPQWRFGPQGEAYDISALGCVATRSTHFWIPNWSATGLRFELGVLSPHQNVPFPLTESFTPQSYVEEMVSGLSKTYCFLADHRRQLAAQIQSAKYLPVRYIFRETLEYYEAINDGLRSGASRRITLGALPRFRAVFDPFRHDEVHALEQLDIPRFTLPASSCDLGGVERCFRESGFALVTNRMEGLCEQDLERQVDALRLAWSLARLFTSLQ